MRKRRTAEHREAICKARKWLCHICGLPIDPVRMKWELDHIIPLASGGSDDDENLAPAHAKCHLEKTVGDVGLIAKGKRMRAKHLGTKPPTSFPTEYTRLKHKFIRKVTGEVVRRDAK